MRSPYLRMQQRASPSDRTPATNDTGPVSDGYRVGVGDFNDGGLYVDGYLGDDRGSYFGVSASWKF